MRIRTVILIVGLIATLILAMPPSQIWAGGAEGVPPGANEKLQGPEIWAVVVLYCVQGEVVVRAKRIQDCIVDTQAVIKIGLSGICEIGGDPIQASDMLYQRLGQSGDLFEITGTPIVTKVKNFKQDPGPTTGLIYSFDAQIKFVVPTQ